MLIPLILIDALLGFSRSTKSSVLLTDHLMPSICNHCISLLKSCWYSNRPLGYHTLSNMVARLCKAAGIHGFKTNHSLRAIAATLLYESGVDEQLVMERTGHGSLDGVRSYKRTTDMQREALSDILNCKRPRLEYPTSSSAGSSHNTLQLDVTTNMLGNTDNSTAGLFHFTSCSNITININK